MLTSLYMICFSFAIIDKVIDYLSTGMSCPDMQAGEFIFVHMPLGQVLGTDG